MARDETPTDDLAVERRLRATMAAVTPQQSDIADAQVAAAIAEFHRVGNVGALGRRLALAAIAAASLGLFAAGGWWANSVSTDSPAVASPNGVRPVRGLTSPCPAIAGVFLGTDSIDGTDVAVFVALRGAEITVRLVDPVSCTEMSVFPAPSPGP